MNYFQEGAKYIEEGAYEKAADIFEKETAANPKYKDAWVNLSFAYLGLGQPARSLECYEQILKRYPKDADAYHKKSILEERLEMSDKALKSIDTALRYAPDNPEYMYTKGWLLYRNNRINESIKLFYAVLNQKPLCFIALDYLYKSLFLLNGFQEIVAHAQTIASIYEKELNRVLEEEKNKDERLIGQDISESAYRFYKDLSDDAFLTAFSTSNKYEKKIETTGIMETPKSDIMRNRVMKIYKYLSLSALRIPEYAVAKKSLLKEIEFNPNDTGARYYIGLVETAAGNINEAVRVFEDVLRRDPSFRNAKMNLASIYSQSEEKTKLCESARLFEEIVRDEPENTHAYYKMAKVYESLGKFDRASDAFYRTIELSPGHMNSYAELAKLHIRKNDLEKAEKLLKKAESLDPFNYEVSNLYGVVLTKKNKYEDAEKMFKKAILLDEWSPKAYFNYGICCLQNEDFEGAVEKLNKAIENDPENAYAYYYIAIAFTKTNGSDEALKAFEKAKSIDPDIEDVDRAIAFVSEN